MVRRPTRHCAGFRAVRVHGRGPRDRAAAARRGRGAQRSLTRRSCWRQGPRRPQPRSDADRDRRAAWRARSRTSTAKACPAIPEAPSRSIARPRARRCRGAVQPRLDVRERPRHAARQRDGVAVLRAGGAQGHEYAKKMLAFVGPARGELPECMRAPDPRRRRAAAARRGARPDSSRLPPRTAEDRRGRGASSRPISDQPRLALAVIAVESNFDAERALGQECAGADAAHSGDLRALQRQEAYDVVQNVRGGLAYLRWLLAYYKGDVALVAAAYNAGEGTVERYRGIPPYPETRAYVQRVLRTVPQGRASV